MSTRYELFFVTSEAFPPDRAAFERHFVSRPNYAVEKGEARYENEDTGVTFSFEIAPRPATGSDRPRAWARFVLDFVRPSFFAEEATRELEPFVERFESGVLDAGDASHTRYSTHAFLKSWEAGNRAACGPYRAGVPGPPFAMPRSSLLAVWHWNYRRRALQAEEGEEVFVPRVWFIRMGQGVATAAIWPDAMAIRVPHVDYVIFSRDALAPRHQLGRRPDVALAAWSSLASSITGSAFYDSPLVNWRIVSNPVLIGLAQRVARMEGTDDMPEIVPPEKVLDLEGFATEPGAAR